MRISAAVAVACLMAGVAVAQSAKAAVRKTTSIPAQELKTALQVLAADRQFQILYRTEFVGGRRTEGATGDLNMDEALDRLLQGTGLSYQYLDDQTVTITPAAPAVSTSSRDASAARGGEKQSFWNGFRLAQANEGAPAVDDTSARAQVAADPARLEEIVVTAQKRQQRVFDVPISIVALGADELQKRNVTGINDLALVVPGLSIESSGGFSRKIALRGISNAFGNSSLTGLYVDEASVTSVGYVQPDLRTYDLERTEVLRGPQGTLYGEGSVGGTIRFITKNPVLDRFSMKADVAALYTDGGAPGQRVETAINVPLIENELGLRIAGTFDHVGGWIDQPAAERNDYNSQNLTNVRVKGLWRPSERFTVNAMAIVHRNDTSVDFGEDDHGDYTQRFHLTTTPSVQDDYDLYNATLTYDFDSVRLLSTTTYLNQDKDVRNIGMPREFFAPGTTPQFELLDTTLPIAFRAKSEELRLTSTGSGPWQWTLGGFYRDARFSSGETGYLGLAIAPGDPLPMKTQYSVRMLSKAWAVFGDVSYKLTERLTLGTGLRYFEDDQQGGTACCALGAPVPLQSGTFDTLNPRLYAQYTLTRNVNTYASAAKGFRSGGFNQISQPSYEPEEVWTYELGTKLSGAEGRLSADIALFFSDYTDYQVNGLVGDPPINMVSNAGKARIKGIEIGVGYRPVENWTLSLTGSYLDDELYEVSVLNNPDGSATASHIVGDRLDNVPQYGYTIAAQRDFTWSGKRGFARLDYNEQGRMIYLGRNIGPWYVSESDVINMLNFGVGLQWNDSLSLGVYAQNLLNDRGYLNPGAIEGIAPKARPRTLMLRFGVSFD